MTAYGTPVPRYTSYPTAPHFSSEVDHVQYASWLSALPTGSDLSLYVHIPFCHQLCWYCGCNTKATRHYAPVARYLRSLEAEIDQVGEPLPDHRVVQIHWGGGSPNMLAPTDIRALSDTIRARFNVDRDAEFAVEMDPRHLDPEQIRAFGRAGISRLSLGVQDFNEAVQAAIGREQSFEMTRRAVDAFRDLGVASINIDLMYGLPRQTTESVEQTAAQVLALEPDRIAVFGYAHLPQRMKHQRLMPAQALPNAAERLAQSATIGQILVDRGYVRVGFDHYAKPADRLAAGNIARNFQGYTTDRCSALIGIGASAIGRLPQGYVQNAVAVADYARRIGQDGLATAKGIALSSEDKARAYVIEQLMCELRFSAIEVREKCGASADDILRDADRVLEADENADFVERTADGFVVTERGRPFLRSICAHFDAYLPGSPALHSSGV
ncbi:MAG TPA: oxygen-independent coproporphyrinogen III oxidase [Hyphomicrobiaceae bacterium]|nr:oxygen-independent coproporphyrinogen III oxidase [Hyphomicrobiaceae bacterium]